MAFTPLQTMAPVTAPATAPATVPAPSPSPATHRNKRCSRCRRRVAAHALLQSELRQSINRPRQLMLICQCLHVCVCVTGKGGRHTHTHAQLNAAVGSFARRHQIKKTRESSRRF